ncbi:MAG: MBL fold metallo-hydrolase [Synergistaceae bacterium]|nr:MBL fold metallo-hydrolase [Synergistaceae bacterium]MBR0076163.1 MBL fold metallo-hydrolase [Synergistaceae bacterium]
MKKIFVLFFVMLFVSSAAFAEEPVVSLGGMDVFSPTLENVPSVKIGDMEIFTLVDARAEIPTSMLIGATEEQIEKYVPSRKLHGQILAFLVKFPGKIILFDTGVGAANGGKLLEALKLLQISPDELDTVVLTHLHFDHISGLIDAEGKANFPKAEIFVSRIEKNYWCNEVKDEYVKKVLAPYEKRIHLFEFGDKLFDCISTIDASGHTPGHTVFDIKRDDGEILVVGDILHADEIMLDEPEIAIIFDVDPVKAPKTRKVILDMAIEKDLPIAGPHFSGTGLWKIQKSGKGYTKTPFLK